MTRLRRYIPVLAYFVALFTVVELRDAGAIASEVPELLVSAFGFCWLIACIWRNRDGSEARETNGNLGSYDNLDPYDARSSAFYTSEAASRRSAFE